jgi:hypothetical protein
MDRMGRLGVVDNWLKTPEMAAAVKDALKDSAPTTFEQAWGMVNGDPKALKAQDPTSLKIEAIKRLAKEKGITFEEAARTQAGHSAGGAVQDRLDAIAASDMSDEDKAMARRVALGVVKTPKGAGGATGAGNSGKPGEGPKGALTPEDFTFMAEQVLAGDNSVFTNLGRGAQGAQNVVGIRQAITRIAKERNLAPDQVAMAIARMQGDKAAFRTAGTKGANIEMAVAEASQLADLAMKASADVSRSGFTPVNKAIQAYNNGTSSPEQGKFAAANLAFINTYARAISPTGVPTVHDKQHAEQVLSTADSHERYVAVVDQMKKEMAAAQQSPGAVRNALSKRMTGGGTVDKSAAPGNRPTPPAVGAVVQGFKFLGGDPALQSSWEKAK